MDTVIGFLNTILRGYVLIYGLLAVGLFFTIRLGLPQIIHFGEMFRVLSSGGSKDTSGISPFQALMVSLASRVGTGNLAGVAVALPGRTGRDLLDVDGSTRRHGDGLCRKCAGAALQGAQ